jgi:tRNA G18 (ribose-2'-O)-methylase SpoU
MAAVSKLTSTDLALAMGMQRAKRHPIFLVLDNVRSAFNVGAAFRTGDAAWIEKICLCGISAYPPNPKLEKTALGSTEVVPWQYYHTTIEAVQELKQHHIPICLVELTTHSVPLWEFHFSQPLALVFGHEVYGVAEEIFGMADSFVSVPMYGKKATLNVSMTLGIVLFEVLRQWQIPTPSVSHPS